MVDLTLASLYDVVRAIERILGPFPVLVLAVDRHGRIVMTNEATRTALDLAEVDLIDRSLDTAVPGLALTFETSADGTVAVTPNGRRRRARRRDGSVFPVEVHASVHQLGDDVLAFVALLDVTERLQADRAVRESQALLDAVLDGLPAMVSAKDSDGRYEFLNPYQADVFGIDPSAAVGRTTAELLGPAGKLIDRTDRRLVSTGAVSRTEEEQLVDAEGRQRRFLTTRAVMRDPAGAAQRLLSVSLDVTHGSAAEERVERLGLLDDRTGLPNRAALHQVLDAQIRTAKRDGTRIGAVVLSIDNLRDIGADLGEEARDGVLRRIGIRLGGLVEDTAVIARYDDQSFAVVLPTFEESDALERRSARLIARAGRPVTIRGMAVDVTCRAGVATYPENGVDADEILRAAELAATDRSGPTVVAIRRYDPDMSDRLRRRREVEHALRRDLERDRLDVTYRPIVTLEDGQAIGFDAGLLDADGRPIRRPDSRWTDVSGAEAHGADDDTGAMAVAEREGLVAPMGEWLLRRACADACSWGGHLPAVVALHPQQLHQPDLIEMVQDILADSEVEPGMLHLSVDESVAAADPDLAARTLRRLADLGIRLSLNDFASGAGSLRMLRSLPIRTVVLGADLVALLPDDPEAVLIARAAIQLALTLGLTVGASGVTTPDQRDLLRSEGCFEASGPAVGAAMPAATVAAFVRRQSALAG